VIEIQGLAKTFGAGSVRAVDGINLHIPSGQIFTLLGPSGCGKTTTLRCVAGLEKPDEGEIRLFGEPVVSTKERLFAPPHARQIGMVFQSYAIWPHMTVFQNVAYPLKGKGYSRREIRKRALSALDKVGLEGLAERPAPNLSGGQQQRVALARAIAGDPKILLLDEPLSNLDAKLREEMRGQIRALQRKLGITTVYVTHDQVEAMALSDTIAIMDKGRVMEVGTPRDVYLLPRSRFAAQFIGLTNVLPARWERMEGEGLARLKTPFASLVCAVDHAEHFASGNGLLMLIRPENILLSSNARVGNRNLWKGILRSATFLGECLDCEIACGDTVIRARVAPFFEAKVGQEVFLQVDPNRCNVITEGRD
jgi:iron(III) transport system ATP-binding protein